MNSSDLFIKIFILIKEILIFGSVGFFVSIIAAPLAFLRTQRQQTGDDYLSLIKKNKEKYGYSVFFSGFFYYAIMNAISSGSFGLVEGLSIPLIKWQNLDPYSFFGILLRTLFLGTFETILIVYFDYKAIQSQKIGLLENKKLKILSFFTPSFIKNTIIWGGTTFSIFIIYKLYESFPDINYMIKILISFTFGVLFATAALPFDVICVKRVGVYDHERSMISILKECIQADGLKRIFAGGMMRVLILGIFTISTVLTDLFLKK